MGIPVSQPVDFVRLLTRLYVSSLQFARPGMEGNDLNGIRVLLRRLT